MPNLKVDRKKVLADMANTVNAPLMQVEEEKLKGPALRQESMDPQSSANFSGIQARLVEKAKADAALRQQMPQQNMDDAAADQFLADEMQAEEAARRELLLRQAMGSRAMPQQEAPASNPSYDMLRKRMGK